MPLCYVSLAVTSLGGEEQLLLVPATEAIRLCSEGGYQRVEGPQLGVRPEQFYRGKMAALRQFLLQTRSASFPIAGLDDTQVLALLRQELKTCNVVALRESDGGQASDSTVQQRRLVREIETRMGRRLTFGGRQYKLVADADLAKLPDRDSYEVVQHDDAVNILGSLAKQTGDGSSDLVALLGKARDKLTPDWRPPLRPDGLILLRRNSSPLGVPSLEPALTPSQIKRLSGKAEWIEIEVLDELGNHYTGPYRIERPDGTTVEGRFGEDEIWGDYDIEPGNCKLILPEVLEVKPGGGVGQKTWIAVQLVDQDGNPITGRAFTLKLPDGSVRSGTTGEDEICYDPIDPGTCVFSLGTQAARSAEPPADAAPTADANVPDDKTDPFTDIPGVPAVEVPAEVPAAEVPAAEVTPQVIDAILMDEDGNPLAGYKFEADFGGGSVMEGQTDETGLIHLEGCPADQCTLKLLPKD